MADNVQITQGTGTSVAADDIGGVLHQRVKVSIGADGAAADLNYGQGAMAASLPVAIASDQSNVPVSDKGPGMASSLGISGARFTSADQSASAADITDLPTAGQKIVVTDLVVSVDTAMRVDLKEETSGTVKMSLYMAANSTVSVVIRGKLKLATADKRLQVQTSIAGNITATAIYHSEA